MTRFAAKGGAQEGSGGLDGQEGILGCVLQVGVESGGYFRIYQGRGHRAENLGRSRDCGGKPAKTHEAGVDQSAVVVEFENLEKAIAAYEGQLYGAALKMVDNTAERVFRIVEGRLTLKWRF